MAEDKERVIQEYVPGKQITLAHLIAHPQEDIYLKIGLDSGEYDALGILTITPSEAAIIAADVASKAANIKIGFVDRFSGSLVIAGDLSSVEAGLKEILAVLSDMMGFSPTEITRT